MRALIALILRWLGIDKRPTGAVVNPVTDEQPAEDVAVDDVDETDPVVLNEVPDDEADEPPANWDPDASDDDYADDPDVTITDDDGDADPKAGA